MRSDTTIRRPFEATPTTYSGHGAPRFDQLEADARRDAAERRTVRWMIAGAVALHAALLFLALPEQGQPAEPARKEQTVFMVQPLKLKPPPPAAERRTIPERRVRKIPIPDPTPDDPEPIVRDEPLRVVDLDLPEADLPFAIPDAPPSAAGSGLAAGVLAVDGSVTPPVKVHSPQPQYTEEARAARVQGVVILQAIINSEGLVDAVEVLKGLPQGLGEAAAEAVRGWTFLPARKDGLPVPVYFNLTVRFSLQ